MRRGSLLVTSEIVHIIISDGKQFLVIIDTYHHIYFEVYNISLVSIWKTQFCVSIITWKNDDPSRVLLYQSYIINTWVNVDFMLGQRRRRLTYINPALSILQRKHDLHRSNVLLKFGLRRKGWTIMKPIIGQCIMLTETVHQ